MTRLLARRLAAAALLLHACGGDGDGADAGAGQDGSPPPDAVQVDASVVDCVADHREAAERSNDPVTVEGGAAEGTAHGVAADSAPFTVCGQIDPAAANRQVADADYYEFTVTGSDPVNVRISMTAPDGGLATGMALDLYLVDEGTPVFLATGPLRTDRSLVAGLLLEPGTYWVAALAFHPAPEQVIPYTIAIEPNTLACPPPAPEATPGYLEAADGIDSRGNDMVSILYPDFALTENPADVAEPTGLVLEPAGAKASPVHLRGVSALVASAGDDYLDRDTYLVTTGDATTEVEVRLSWPDGDVDLDLFLFAAGDPDEDYSLGLGTVVGEQSDELFTVAVDPARSYWLWIGAFDDTGEGGATMRPVAYDLSLCPRTHLGGE